MRRFALLLVLPLLLIGCGTSRQQVLATDSSQVQLRSIQTRVFDTTDRERTLRTVIATLQDLSFVIDKADATLGSVSATKLDRYRLRMTVTVRRRGQTQTLVRASAQYNLRAVEDPLPYQQFFSALEKAMFLTAQETDGSMPGAGSRAPSSVPPPAVAAQPVGPRPAAPPVAASPQPGQRPATLALAATPQHARAPEPTPIQQHARADKATAPATAAEPRVAKHLDRVVVARQMNATPRAAVHRPAPATLPLTAVAFVSAEDSHIRVPGATLAKVHRALSNAGYGTMREWGRYGSGTVSNVKRFQIDHVLDATGLIDRPTWKILAPFLR